MTVIKIRHETVVVTAATMMFHKSMRQTLQDRHFDNMHKQESSNIFTMETVIIGYRYKSVAPTTTLNKEEITVYVRQPERFSVRVTVKGNKAAVGYYYVK